MSITAQAKALGISRSSVYYKSCPVERFFLYLKGFRAIATRYDKLASTFLAAVQLVSALIWLN